MAGNTDQIAARTAIVQEYAQAFKQYAAQWRGEESKLIPSFDGARVAGAKPVLSNLLKRIDVLNSANSYPSPFIELVDNLLAYIIANPHASLAHDAQDSVTSLYENIVGFLDEYYNSSDKESLGAKARVFNQIRLAVWMAVQDRNHGLLHDAGWLFLTQVARLKRNELFVIPSLEDIYPYNSPMPKSGGFEAGDTDIEVTREYKAHFKKAVLAAQQHPAGLQAFLIWISRILKSLTARRPVDPNLEEYNEPFNANGSANPAAQIGVNVGGLAARAPVITVSTATLPFDALSSGTRSGHQHRHSARIWMDEVRENSPSSGLGRHSPALFGRRLSNGGGTSPSPTSTASDSPRLTGRG